MLAALIGSALLVLGSSCGKSESSSRGTPHAAAPGSGATAQTEAAKTPAPEQPELPHRVFASPAEALTAILASQPRVLGIGEYHQTTATAHVPSALQRFTRELLDVIGAATSDLILETWVEDGACGKAEQQVGGQVQAVTQRPPETENQVLTLLERARGLGIQPHVLRLRCDDYAMLLDDRGEVDYEQLLVLITRELRATTLRVLAQNKTRASAAGMTSARPLIALYGGSLHNDLYPYESLAMYSYAVDLAKHAAGRYVELDLYVPEFIEGNALLSGEAWYPLFQRLAAPERVILIERGPDSFIMILPRTRGSGS